jgi:hypothetical protein
VLKKIGRFFSGKLIHDLLPSLAIMRFATDLHR